jgi:hypothetical protein
LFADLNGSMELLADRNPEEARRLLDPVSNGNIMRAACVGHRAGMPAGCAADLQRIALLSERIRAGWCWPAA